MLHYLNNISASTPPLCRTVYYKKHTRLVSVLVHYLFLFLRPFCILGYMNITCYGGDFDPTVTLRGQVTSERLYVRFHIYILRSPS
jgi:hypothetical protein